MKTEEGIKFCVDLQRQSWNMYFESYDNKKQQYLKGVIKLLQRGEKYEKMWKELDAFVMLSTSAYSVINEMGKIKRKYFPKPKSRRQRINDILEQLNDLSIQTDIKALKSLLIEVRDEECDEN
ncbi:MAG: hypothetical protein JRE23_15915 [Deltaproteobacteria bacterium]|nr:hypothetical protein [Deltaproteobacteria bacterium]